MGKKHLTKEDFDTIKDLQTHGYTGVGAAKVMGWSGSTTSRVFRTNSFEEYNLRTVRPPEPTPPSLLEVDPQSPKIPLVEAIEGLQHDLVENTKATWALRRDLTQSMNTLADAINAAFHNNPPTQADEDKPEEAV